MITPLSNAAGRDQDACVCGHLRSDHQEGARACKPLGYECACLRFQLYSYDPAIDRQDAEEAVKGE